VDEQDAVDSALRVRGPNLITDSGSNEVVITYNVLFEGPGGRELKAHPELMAEQKTLKNATNGFLVEVLDKRSGAYLRGIVADERRNGFGWTMTTPKVTAFGDFAVVESGLQTAVVYRFSTGARVGEVFGEVTSGDAASGLFAVTNRDNDLVIYDAATVHERKHFTYNTGVRLAQFLPARKEFFVFTGDQKVHTISIDDLHSDAAPAHPAQ